MKLYPELLHLADETGREIAVDPSLIVAVSTFERAPQFTPHEGSEQYPIEVVLFNRRPATPPSSGGDNPYGWQPVDKDAFNRIYHISFKTNERRREVYMQILEARKKAAIFHNAQPDDMAS